MRFLEPLLAFIGLFGMLFLTFLWGIHAVQKKYQEVYEAQENLIQYMEDHIKSTAGGEFFLGGVKNKKDAINKLREDRAGLNKLV